MIGKVAAVPHDPLRTIQRNVAGTSDSFHRWSVRNSIISQFGDQTPTQFPSLRSKEPQRFKSTGFPWHSDYAVPPFGPIPMGATDGTVPLPGSPAGRLKELEPRSSAENEGKNGEDGNSKAMQEGMNKHVSWQESARFSTKTHLPGRSRKIPGMIDTGHLRAASAKLTLDRTTSGSRPDSQQRILDFPPSTLATAPTFHGRAMADSLSGRSAIEAANALANADYKAKAAAMKQKLDASAKETSANMRKSFQAMQEGGGNGEELRNSGRSSTSIAPPESKLKVRVSTRTFRERLQCLEVYFEQHIGF
jgi:hypothetical protein